MRISVFVSASASKVRTVPKSSVLYRAKSALTVGDDKHDSEIKRGETFRLYENGGKFYLLDFDKDSSSYYKFELTKYKFNKIRKEHTLLDKPEAESKQKSKPKVRTRESARRADVKRRSNSVFTKADKAFREASEDLRNKQATLIALMEERDLLQKANNVKRDLNRVIQTANDYINGDVALTDATKSFLDALGFMLESYTGLKEESASTKAAWTLAQCKLLEETYKIDMSGNPIRDLQHRRTQAQIKQLRPAIGPSKQKDEPTVILPFKKIRTLYESKSFNIAKLKRRPAAPCKIYR